MSLLVPSGSGRCQPGMVEQARQVKPILRSDAKAASDQLLTFRRDVATKVDLGVADLLIFLEGDVALDHVVEEDAKRPDGERVALVSRASNPFWGGVYSGAVKVSESVLLVEGAGAEVDQLEFARLEVNQEVLILDVPVDDSPPVAGENRLDHLPEEASGQLLLKNSFLSDEVEEVLSRGGPLHDEDEGVRPLKEVEEFDHSLNILDAVQQLQLKRDSPTVQLIPLGDFPPCHMLDCH